MRTTLLIIFSAVVVNKGVSQRHLTIAQGAKSTIFMQDSAAAPNGESTPTFLPDGKTVYLANNAIICLSKRVGDHWTKPIPISFTGQVIRPCGEAAGSQREPIFQQLEKFL